MKKSLIIVGLAASIMLTSTIANASTTPANTDKQPVGVEKQLPKKHDKKMKHSPIDERLKLTDEQKQQAHEIRMKGHKEMKPIFDKIKAKKEEMKQIANNPKLSEEQKTKKIDALEIEILKLKQQARKVRIKNAKEFEAILTPEQKAEFNKMKEEGRKMHMMKKRNGHKKPAKFPQQAPQK